MRSFEATSTLTGEPTLFGISTSQKFPLAVGIGVQVKMLQQAWLSRHLQEFLMVLATSATGIYVTLHLMASRRKEQAYLRHQEYLASHDALTGLPNRYAFLQRLRQRIDEPGQEALAVVVLGLNRFKEVNDTLGHLAGDNALAQIAQRLQESFGTGQRFVARLSGDELAVCTPLPDGEAGVRQLCADIAAAIHRDINIDGVGAAPSGAGAGTAMARQ